MIRELGRNLDATTAIVILPEGRLFRPDRLERAKTRLALENPERSARLASLGQVLPARPSGVLALVDTIDADVVFIAHTGLDQCASFAELAKAVQCRDPIHVEAWRVPREQIPDGDAERINWLDEQWLLVDNRLAASLVGERTAR